jgi:hypothetical protein
LPLPPSVSLSLNETSVFCLGTYGADKSLASPVCYFPICTTTKRIFLGWVKEVRTTKSCVDILPDRIEEDSQRSSLLECLFFKNSMSMAIPTWKWSVSWPNPCRRTMALGSTPPLTETSTRNLPGSKGRPLRHLWADFQ